MRDAASETSGEGEADTRAIALFFFRAVRKLAEAVLGVAKPVDGVRHDSPLSSSSLEHRGRACAGLTAECWFCNLSCRPIRAGLAETGKSRS